MGFDANGFLYVCFQILLGWYVIWYLIYLVTGFHLRSIGINNGILFNGISFTSKKARISIGTLRFRLWGNTRMIILDEVDLQLNESSKTKRKTKEEASSKDAESMHNMGSAQIYPHNPILKALLKLMIQHIPNIDLEVRHLTIGHKSVLVTTVQYFRLTLNSSKSGINRKEVKFSSVLNTNNIAWTPTDENYGKSVSLATVKFQAELHVSIDTGKISELLTKIFTDELRINAYNLLRWISVHKNADEVESKESNSSKAHRGKSKPSIRAMKWHNYLYPCIKEISVMSENTKILEIPVLCSDDKNDYFNFWDTYSHRNYINIDVKSWSHTIRKLNKDSAGFHILFDSKLDTPIQAVTAFQILRVEFTNTQYDYNVEPHVSEIISIPNCSLTHIGNMSDHLVKGDGFKDCAVEAFSTLSNPTLDLNADQLSIVCYNLITLKKFLKVRKLMKFQEGRGESFADESCDIDDTKVDLDEDESSIKNGRSSSTGSKADKLKRSSIIGLLNEYYPRLNLTLIIEQPRIIIRENDQDYHCQKLVNFSYSILNFHVLTTQQRDYDARCHILHPSITYQSHGEGIKTENLKKEMFVSESIGCRLQVLKSFEVKAFFEIGQTTVKVNKLNLLSGLASLMDNLKTTITKRLQSSKLLEQLEKIGKEKALEYKKPSTVRKPAILQPLPPWLLEFSFEISSFRLILGSRSLLIPGSEITKFSDDVVGKDTFGDYNHLKTTNILLESVKMHWVKAKKDVKDNNFALLLPSTSLETLGTDVSELWKLDTKILKFEIFVNVDDSDEVQSVLHIPQVDLNFVAFEGPSNTRLTINSSVERGTLVYDTFKFFIVLGTVNLFSQLFAPFKAMKENIRDKSVENFEKDELKIPKTDIEIQCNFKILELILDLSEECTIKAQIMDARYFTKDADKHVMMKLLRVMINSPTVPNAWNRVLCADSLRANINTSSKVPVEIQTNFIKMVQPHGLVVYHLFDSMSITIKIIKHLISSLKSESEKTRYVKPSESKAKILPPIRVKSSRILYQMEDDPFESELNMVHQLGLVEQRKRLEQLSLFDMRWEQEHKCQDGNSDSDSEYYTKLEQLHQHMARSWIRKVMLYRAKLKEELACNKAFLFGSEVKTESDLNEQIVPYLIHAPLLSLLLLDVDLDLSSVEHPENVADMIHKLGQGVPTDTKYSLLLPLYVQLKVLEVRMHLRDYPLPILHIPYVDDRGALNMHGNFIVSEALVDSKENLRRMEVPLSKVLKDANSEKYYSLCIDKSLTTVKLYSDMKFNVSSSEPARFVWGQSYQFGIQQIMLNLDQFSKPPVDPSLKLGFWDKLRLVFHGKFNVTSDTGTGLEIAFKGSRDPYNLFGDGRGFVLSFKDDLDWRINEDDDPRHFFKVNAKKVSWYIPNYLRGPLVTWSRDSSKSIYLPSSDTIITSCFAYYLQDCPSAPSGQKRDIIEKNVVRLSGGVSFKVGFMLERYDDQGEKTFDCKPHYEINLFNPEYTDNGHDSYAGFRSDYVHMSIALEANSKKSSNAIYLSPNTFQQFFRWWKLFQSNMMLPVRRGPMFGELKQSVKFSQHLMTNKFQFHIKSLFIAHVYRDRPDSDSDMLLCVGLKAKVEEFVVDLHLRKEQRIIVHEALSRDQKTLKMNFNIGEVHLNGIDLRLIRGDFNFDVYKANDGREGKGEEQGTGIKFTSFDKEKLWLDEEDFDEAQAPSLRKSSGEVKVFPLLYSKRFTYLRDTMDEDDENEFGNEPIHECFLDKMDQLSPAEELLHERLADLKKQASKSNSLHLSDRINFLQKQIGRDRKNSVVSQASIGQKSSKDKFHNRFALVGMFLKWNEDSRNALLKYIHYSQLKGTMAKYLSYDAISTLEELQEEAERASNDELSTALSNQRSSINVQTDPDEEYARFNKDQNAEKRLRSFDKILKSCGPNEAVMEDFKIEIISPQIQLSSEVDSDAVVLVTSPKIDIKIVSVVEGNSDALVVNPKELLYRYGVVLHEANVFVINKDDTESSNELALSSQAYGSQTNWPPWLGIEICQQGRLAGTKKLLIENMSLMVMYDQIRPLGKNVNRYDESSSFSEDLSNKSESDSEQIVSINKLCVDIPQVVITSTSQQYFTLYVIVNGLFFYTEPMSKSLSERLEKLKLTIDFQDLKALHSNLTYLHRYHKLMGYLLHNYEFRQDTMNNEQLNEALTIRSIREDVASEIHSLMQILLSGDFNKSGLGSTASAEWFIRTDQIILHMLEDDGTPILDLAMANNNYRRMVYEDGTNTNNISIEMMQGFNLVKESHYPALIEPLEEFVDNKQTLVNVHWKMKRPVGGIRIMEEFQISSQPLKVKIDEITGDKLMKYIFQSDASDIKHSPILQNQHTKANDGVEDDLKVSSDDHDDTDEVSTSDELDSSSRKRGSSLGRSSDQSSNNKKVRLLATSSTDYEFHDQVDDMVSRSKEYLSIIDFKLNSFKALVSLKYKTGIKRLLNIQDFVINFPELVIRKRMMSLLDIALMVKKIVLKSLMRHSGSLLKNKLTVQHHPKRKITAPLKPIRKYARFTKVSELYLDSHDSLAT